MQVCEAPWGPLQKKEKKWFIEKSRKRQFAVSSIKWCDVLTFDEKVIADSGFVLKRLRQGKKAIKTRFFTS